MAEPVRLAVAGPLGHPIAIGAGLLDRLPEECAAADLAPPRRILLVADRAVRPVAERIAARLAAAGHSVSTAWLEASEARKDLGTLEAIWAAALAARLTRRDAFLALGGGMVGDVVGFAAATYLRGLALIACPTTLLAMVDASTGGKTGINLPLPGTPGELGKNLAGSFHPPRFVIVDPEVLTTLPEREFRSGLAECLKHAILDGDGHLAWLEAHAAAIFRRDPETLADLLARSVAVKAGVVGRDPFERGERAHLNLGHTFGHALETLPELHLTHGEAVALGCLAAAAAGGNAELAARVERLARALGLPVRLPAPLDRAAFDRRLGFDKKADSAGVRLVLPRAPGRIELVPATVAAIDAGLAAIDPARPAS